VPTYVRPVELLLLPPRCTEFSGWLLTGHREGDATEEPFCLPLRLFRGPSVAGREARHGAANGGGTCLMSAAAAVPLLAAIMDRRGKDTQLHGNAAFYVGHKGALPSLTKLCESLLVFYSSSRIILTAVMIACVI